MVVFLLEHVELPHLPDAGLVLGPLGNLVNTLRFPEAGLAWPSSWSLWTCSSLGLKLSSSQELTLSLDLVQVWYSTILSPCWDPSKASCSSPLNP